MPLWLSEPDSSVPRLVAGIERGKVLDLGTATVVTLTVAPGVDLDAVGQDFGERMAGLFSGVWLVPETSPKGRRHYHGVIVGASPGTILAAWQRSSGGIERAQCFDPIEPGDHWHLRRAVAYAMKRRHVEPGEAIATGVLASPWAAATEPGDDDGPDIPLGAEIGHLDDDVCYPPTDDEPDLPLGTEIAHLDDEPEATLNGAVNCRSRPWG